MREVESFHAETIDKSAQVAMRQRFGVKKFHRLVLTSGQLPMPVLRDTVNAWVQAEKKSGGL